MAYIDPYIAILTLLLTISLLSSAQSQTCISQNFTNKRLYQHCSDLSELNAYIHWTYDSSNLTLSIAFVAPPDKPDGWISWAINPTGTGMAGAQSLVAFKDSTGSMTVKTYNIESYSDIIPGKLSFDVMEMTSDYVGGMMRIFATLKLPVSIGTTVNQVWQVGATVKSDFPAMHGVGPANLNSMGMLDLLNWRGGSGVPARGGDSKSKNRNIHGILNVVSWGIMLPVGIMIARYLKVFPSADPTWFYLHVLCQVCAYIIGVAGYGTGIMLGNQSKGVQYTDHRNIGISLFMLATVQLFALFMRPKKEHKLRLYWNIYHHVMGYVIIILGIINVFKGIDILQPETKWKIAYIVAIIILGVIGAVLEAITWVVVLRRTSST